MIVIVKSVKHYKIGDKYKGIISSPYELIELKWESDGNEGFDTIPAYKMLVPGSRNKWMERSIIVRESLK